MKTNSSDNIELRWQKTPVANPIRHVQSSNHYARIRVRGKLIWKSLKTDRISVAKLRLGDFHKEKRQRKALAEVLKSGSVASGWLVKNLQVTYDTANRDLLALAELKILVRNGKGRASKYVLLEAKTRA